MQAGLVLWVGWAVIHLVVFSVLLGLFHAYYTSALAPAIAVLAAFGACELWTRRTTSTRSQLATASALGATAILAVLLLLRSPHFTPWLRWVVPLLSAAGFAGILFAGQRHQGPVRAGLTAAVLLLGIIAGPLSYSWATTERQLGGIDPLAGPGPREEPLWASDDSRSEATLIKYLVSHRDGSQYLAAADGSLVGAPLELLAGRPVLIMGGFAGSDPAPTPSRLAALVAHGQVRYVVLAGPPSTTQGGLATGLGGARTRADRVRAHCLSVLRESLPAPSGRLRLWVYRCPRPS